MEGMEMDMLDSSREEKVPTVEAEANWQSKNIDSGNESLKQNKNIWQIDFLSKAMHLKAEDIMHY